MDECEQSVNLKHESAVIQNQSDYAIRVSNLDDPGHPSPAGIVVPEMSQILPMLKLPMQIMPSLWPKIGFL